MPKKKGTETIVRHWQLLKLLPSEPWAISVAELRDRLADQGIVVSRRTVERDLLKLAIDARMPIRQGETDGAQCWMWMQDGASKFRPNPPISEAALLVLASQFMAGRVPRLFIEAFRPTVKASELSLSALPGALGKRWASKLHAVPTSAPRPSSAYAHHRPRNVFESVMEERKLSLWYVRREHEAESLTVNPHALVQREMQTLLVATCDPGNELRVLALDRMRRTSKGTERARLVKGFDLEAFVRDGFEVWE